MGPNSQFSADLFPFTEEILNGKLHFLRSGLSKEESLDHGLPNISSFCD